MQGGIIGRDERWWDNLGRNKRGNNSGWNSRGRNNKGRCNRGRTAKGGIIKGTKERERDMRESNRPLSLFPLRPPLPENPAPPIS
jgi:hypothetical protein